MDFDIYYGTGKITLPFHS